MGLKRAARVILIGAPGAGKGTQTERLKARFPELSAISSGDLLRENVRSRTPLGILAEAKMKTGALVPDSMILRLIHSEFDKRGWLNPDTVLPYSLNAISAEVSDAARLDSANVEIPPLYSYSNCPTASFILDGFPRTAAQAAQVDSLIPINMVVHIDTPASIILDRICNRWVHAPSGRVYNTTFNAPKVPRRDDVTGEPLSRRDDDDPAVWEARLKNFESSSLPLLEHYDKLGVIWSVKGNSSDEITPRLFDEFRRRFGFDDI